MTAYLALARTAFQTQVSYRGQVWASLFGELVQVFARVAIWTSLFAGVTATAEASREDMVTYAVLAGTVIAAWTPTRMLSQLGTALRTGDVAMRLVSPVPYPLFLFWSECGNLAYRVVVVVAPVVAVAALIYGVRLPASLLDGVAFPGFWALSFVLLFELACLGGLLAFWLFTVFSIEWLLWALISLFSGSLVPLWFFPDWLRVLAQHLPFAWLAYYPAAVYLGKLQPGQLMVYTALGLGWAILIGLGIAWLWARATRRIVVQGG